MKNSFICLIVSGISENKMHQEGERNEGYVNRRISIHHSGIAF